MTTEQIEQVLQEYSCNIITNDGQPVNALWSADFEQAAKAIKALSNGTKTSAEKNAFSILVGFLHTNPDIKQLLSNAILAADMDSSMLEDMNKVFNGDITSANT